MGNFQNEFGNMVKNLEIDQYPNFDPVINNIKNPRQVLKKIYNLKMNKASQSLDIPTKVVKENVNVFAEFLWKSINSSIKSSTKSCLNRLMIT